MIAEIHGKISSTGSNLSERLEDQLTGDVFGTLRYIHERVGLLPFLESSYFLTKSGERVQLHDLSSAIVKEIRFWPWIVNAEPDVLIKLQLNGNKEGVILIEAKYHSPLSSDDSSDDTSGLEKTDTSIHIDIQLDNAARPEQSRNQLIRQMRGMKTRYPGLRRVQIFLTSERIYPREILSRVRQRADAEGLGDNELYWLSWHDLPGTLRRANERGEWLSDREKIVLFDLLRLCERKGFGRFSQLDPCTYAIPGACRLAKLNPRNHTPTPVPLHMATAPKAISSFIHMASLGVPRGELAIYQEKTDGN